MCLSRLQDIRSTGKQPIAFLQIINEQSELEINVTTSFTS